MPDFSNLKSHTLPFFPSPPNPLAHRGFVTKPVGRVRGTKRTLPGSQYCHRLLRHPPRGAGRGGRRERQRWRGWGQPFREALAGMLLISASGMKSDLAAKTSFSKKYWFLQVPVFQSLDTSYLYLHDHKRGALPFRCYDTTPPTRLLCDYFFFLFPFLLLLFLSPCFLLFFFF